MSAEPRHEELPFLYASGELAPGPTADFERHSPSCPACLTALKDMRWASSLAALTAASPHPALVERSIQAAMGAATPAISWWEAARPAAFGLGFSLAVLVFIARVPREPEQALRWRNGLEHELSDLQARIGDLDAALSPRDAEDEWERDFNKAWKDIRRRQKTLDTELGGDS